MDTAAPNRNMREPMFTGLLVPARPSSGSLPVAARARPLRKFAASNGRRRTGPAAVQRSAPWPVSTPACVSRSSGAKCSPNPASRQTGHTGPERDASIHTSNTIFSQLVRLLITSRQFLIGHIRNVSVSESAALGRLVTGDRNPRRAPRGLAIAQQCGSRRS